MVYENGGVLESLFKGATSHALMILDDRGVICLGTQGVWELLGVSEGYAVGRSFYDVVTNPASLEGGESREILEIARKKGMAVEGEILWSSFEEEGFCISVNVEYVNVAGEGGKGFIVSLAPMKNFPHIEDQLKESLRMLNEAEQKAGLGHWRLSLETQEIQWSRGVYHIHGFEEGAYVTLDDAINSYIPEDRERIERVMAEALANKEGFYFKASLKHPDGDLCTVDVRGDVELNEEGVPVSLFGVIHDCTAENEIARQLIVARDDAVAESEANRMLLATMSHEIRTPLSGVISMLDEMLVEEKAKNQRIDARPNVSVLNTIRTASQALMSTLNDVLDHTRIESGNLHLDPCRFDLSEIVIGTTDLFQSAARDKGIGLKRIVAGPLWVKGDPVRIQQIVSNFVSNAIKFTVRGGVEVSLSSECQDLLIEVSDTGIGIAVEDQEKLFKPFQQAEKSIASRFGGTGLGLSICSRLAEAMGGKIGVISEPGVGSRFWFSVSLPRVDDKEDRDKGGGVVDTLPRIKEREPHVLIVDDTKTNVLIAEGQLRLLGAACVEAGNGFEALQELLASTFDAILMDGKMPILNGLNCVRLIRLLPPPLCNVPVIAYTAERRVDVQVEFDSVGFDDIIEKPLDRETLFTTLERVLDERRGDGEVKSSNFEFLLSIGMVFERLEDRMLTGDRKAVERILETLYAKAEAEDNGTLHAICIFLRESLALLSMTHVHSLLCALSQQETSRQSSHSDSLQGPKS
ncbi:hybrid sensor histidine kinase/response regulator [Modicisalibacter radicis]|uniref:hybrid sensor histidine kinase/response regulator n=1 Tax=Halomonas sp. EAR18 TaxID=2518972 RepID=UPI00109C9B88|nr:hybrid sensor histidine kinase/response regulator [Halomonas sp. EAR18]